MPLNTAGQIISHAASAAGETRFQADPPVCNLCQREITPQTFGWTSLERDGATQGYVEFISCTACTAVREAGQPLPGLFGTAQAVATAGSHTGQRPRRSRCWQRLKPGVERWESLGDPHG